MPTFDPNNANYFDMFAPQYYNLDTVQPPSGASMAALNEGTLEKIVTQPAAETTAVSGPDVNGQVDEDDQDPFKESWIELHELKG